MMRRKSMMRKNDCPVVRDLMPLVIDRVASDESRELVFKKYYEQKSNKQIALEMDMNASTVSTKLSRAMAKMRTVAQREGL